MIRILTAMLTVGIAVSGMNSAQACCLWPFGGWWGAGYGGYYSAGYAPYVPVADGYYSAGYGSSACCVPVCCDPCGNGGCATGSCVGTTPSGSLKPQTDPNFDRGSKEKEEDPYDTFDRDRLKRREESADPDLDRDRTLEPRRRTAPVDPDPIDDFRSAPMGGADSDMETFGTGSDQIKNKPPMADPDVDLPAVDPGSDMDKVDEPSFDSGTSGSTFFDEKSEPSGFGPETRVQRTFSMTTRPSRLNEVVGPKRLASRSLPSTSTGRSAASRTSVAGPPDSEKSTERTPLRWISVPLPEGHVRL